MSEQEVGRQSRPVEATVVPDLGLNATRYLLGRAIEKLSEQSDSLRVIREKCCGSDTTEQLEAQIALDDARHEIASARQDVKRALARMEEAWKIMRPNV